MRVTNIYEAKTQLSRLIEQALKGDEVIIAKAGKPLVKLVAYNPPQQSRQPGAWQGQVKISADFNQMPDDLQRAFNGDDA